MRAVLFDLYGVIMYEQNDEYLRSIEEAVGHSDQAFWDSYWAVRHEFDAGNVKSAEYWQMVSDHLGRPIKDPEEATRIDIESWLRQDDSMVDYIKRLHSEEVRVGVLSNITSELADAMLERNDWLQLFNPLVLSCETGFAKPQPEIYELAVDKFGLPAENILFVDDRPVNVKGAQTVGLSAHLFTSKNTLIPVVEAHLAD